MLDVFRWKALWHGYSHFPFKPLTLWNLSSVYCRLSLTRGPVCYSSCRRWGPLTVWEGVLPLPRTAADRLCREEGQGISWAGIVESWVWASLGEPAFSGEGTQRKGQRLQPALPKVWVRERWGRGRRPSENEKSYWEQKSCTAGNICW